MEITNVLSYKITLSEGSLNFYPEIQTLIFEYYDEKEDEDYEVTIWKDGVFLVADVPFDKDKYLTIFKEYEEKNK